MVGGDVDGALYVCAAAVDRRADALVVTTAQGAVRFEDEKDALDLLEGVLRRAAGVVRGEDLLAGFEREVWDTVAPALESIGALYDLRYFWRAFQSWSSLPFVVPPPLSEDAAYALAGLRHPSPAAGNRRDLVDVSATVPQRAPSVDFETVERVDGQTSLEAAIALAHAAYAIDTRGHRAVASAGAMWPLRFWVVGGVGDRVKRHFIDHAAQSSLIVGDIARSEWCAAFVPDPHLHAVISDGAAAAIVITADPSRTTGKYGSRGWRYVLLEAGAAMHQVGLSAPQFGAAVRPIGGFMDQAIKELLDPEAEPVLTIVVVNETPCS